MSEREEIAHLLKGSRRFYSAYILLLLGEKIEDKWKQDLSVGDWLKGTHHLETKGNGHSTCKTLLQNCSVFGCQVIESDDILYKDMQVFNILKAIKVHFFTDSDNLLLIIKDYRFNQEALDEYVFSQGKVAIS